MIFLLLLICTFAQCEENTNKPKRIYADIVGDLFHAGHVEFFKKARMYGDYLIVGVLSDEDVKSYKRTPILSLKERAEVIKACKYVDEVILAPPLRVTKKWLKAHQIDLVVHGDDFDATMCYDQYKVPIQMKIFKTVPYTKGISSTDIIRRICDRMQPQDNAHCKK